MSVLVRIDDHNVAHTGMCTATPDLGTRDLLTTDATWHYPCWLFNGDPLSTTNSLVELLRAVSAHADAVPSAHWEEALEMGLQHAHSCREAGSKNRANRSSNILASLVLEPVLLEALCAFLRVDETAPADVVVDVSDAASATRIQEVLVTYALELARPRTHDLVALQRSTADLLGRHTLLDLEVQGSWERTGLEATLEAAAVVRGPEYSVGALAAALEVAGAL